MPLDVPTYQAPSGQYTDAYARIINQWVDYSAPNGLITIGVWSGSAAYAAGYGTVDQITVALDQMLSPANPTASPPVAEVDFYSFPGLYEQAAAYQAANPSSNPFDSINACIYALLADGHPKLAGSSIVA
jgi:hypothetical protein